MMCAILPSITNHKFSINKILTKSNNYKKNAKTYIMGPIKKGGTGAYYVVCMKININGVSIELVSYAN